MFAVGDVTATSAYTHSANHQARVVVAEVAGRGYDADYSANPRALYTEPPVLCAGLTPQQADEDALRTRRLALDLDQVERGSLVQATTSADGDQPLRGRVELVLDTNTDLLVGASCVGPAADVWGAELEHREQAVRQAQTVATGAWPWTGGSASLRRYRGGGRPRSRERGVA